MDTEAGLFTCIIHILFISGSENSSQAVSMLYINGLFDLFQMFFHFYIHSFRAAQGTKRHEKNVGLLQLSFYNCSIGIFSILQITGR